ncbi:aminotransferase-like domain-containing protein [Kocuria sp. cx-455]|uniref:aminotransferase-like domain-containing protein n=1 Tax=Kocuria sp. cx-455 TaxID=2771377 RepID=UPI001CC22E43|nr:PLP-dependent aminotransferase family protein [Kocuria sp. cx-455]
MSHTTDTDHNTALGFGLEHCATGVRNAKASEVRKVFAMSARPGMISFASGLPELGALPYDQLADIAAGLLRERGPEVMQYGASTGTPGLKEQILGLMRLEGIDNAAPDDVVVTTGSQNGLDLLTRILVDPGDVVLAESPSYSGALAVFTGAQAEVVHVPSDDQGLLPDELERTIARLQGQGRAIKFLYTIPSYQNPGGTMLSQERRDRVRQICADAHVLVAEDNPYGLLGFDGTPARAMRADDPNVVYLGSFSKMFAPGPRVGWTVLPSSLARPFGLQAEAAVLNPSVLTQEIVAAYLRDTDWQAVLEHYRALYARRAEAMVRGLQEHMPEGVTWNVPRGGFYCWLSLPEGVDSYELCLAAIDQGVVFVPGTAFYTDGRGHREARLSYCHPTEEKIAEGTRILGATLTSFLNR